jgi:hypothetical protein
MLTQNRLSIIKSYRLERIAENLRPLDYSKFVNLGQKALSSWVYPEPLKISESLTGIREWKQNYLDKENNIVNLTLPEQIHLLNSEEAKKILGIKTRLGNWQEFDKINMSYDLGDTLCDKTGTSSTIYIRKDKGYDLKNISDVKFIEKVTPRQVILDEGKETPEKNEKILHVQYIVKPETRQFTEKEKDEIVNRHLSRLGLYYEDYRDYINKSGPNFLTPTFWIDAYEGIFHTMLENPLQTSRRKATILFTDEDPRK